MHCTQRTRYAVAQIVSFSFLLSMLTISTQSVSAQPGSADAGRAASLHSPPPAPPASKEQASVLLADGAATASSAATGSSATGAASASTNSNLQGNVSKQAKEELKQEEKAAAKEEAKTEKQEKKEEKEKEEKQEAKVKEEAKEVKNEGKEARADAPCLSWVKAGVPVRAMLLCVHGVGLSSDSWTKFGQDMSKLGVATYAIDVRGFGSWVVAKGRDKCDFSGCMNDVDKTLKSLRLANPQKPVFLMGESMGGAIVLHVAAETPQLIDGVISVCSSGDRFKQKRTDLKVFLHMLMGPRRKFDIGDKIVAQASGSDTALKKEWESDKLDQMKLSPIELLQFQHFMNENHDEAKKIRSLPVLMVQGTKDKLVKPEGTEELFNELKTPDKQIIMVEDAKHLIFEEQQYSDLTLAQLSSWIFKRCPKPNPFDEAVAKGRANLEQGNLQQALVNLNLAVKLKPHDPNVHLLLGLLQTKLQHPLLARQQLFLASRLGKGSAISVQANNSMLLLPQNILAPRRAALAAGKKSPFTPAEQPTVLVFNATWSQPGKDMQAVVDQAKIKYGTKVKFQMVDVDDPKNVELVDHYSIGPVPTTIFLTPTGDVASFQVGFDGMDGMVRGLEKVLPILPAH